MPSTRRSRTARRCAAAGVWFALLFAAWALWVGQSTIVNWIAGSCAAAVASAGATALVVRGSYAFTLRRKWLLTLPRVGWQIVADVGIVLGALARAVARGSRESPGGFVAREFDSGGRTVRGASWRAFAAFAASWSPNSYVVDVNQEQKYRINHDLVPRRASEEPA